MDEFCSVFLHNCEANSCKLRPNLKLLCEEQKISAVKFDTSLDSSPELIVIFSKLQLQKVFYRSTSMELALVEALGTTLQEYPTLTVLKLEFCRLEAPHITRLQQILQAVPTISQLSVNGNPNPSQNYHLLVQGTRVSNLSLKFCLIDQFGLANLSAELCKSGSALLHLNLSTNQCFDEGVPHLVKFLRVNRTLLSLNLADNKIGCEGCTMLTRAFRKFALEQDEIVIRRRIRMECIRRVMDVERRKESTQSNESKAVASDIHFEKKSKRKHTSRSSNPEDRKSRTSKDTVKLDSIKPRASGDMQLRRDGSIMKLDNQYHPFVNDSYEEGDEIYCIGNNTLINLNLAYNNIQQVGLLAIIDMLKYQLHIFPEHGITHLSVQGNARYKCSQEYTNIQILLEKRKMSITMRKISNIPERQPKPSTAASVSTELSLFANR